MRVGWARAVGRRARTRGRGHRRRIRGCGGVARGRRIVRGLRCRGRTRARRGFVCGRGCVGGRAVELRGGGVFGAKMMRRYSGPRHFTPGWLMPRRVLETTWVGLTTIPSPPAAVSSVHQAVAACSEASSPRVTSIVRVAQKHVRVGVGEPTGERDVPGMGVEGTGPVLRWRALGTGRCGGRRVLRSPSGRAAIGVDVCRGHAVPGGGAIGVRNGLIESAGDGGPHLLFGVQRGERGGADAGVLVADQIGGLGGPGQHFGVEDHPVRVSWFFTGRACPRSPERGRGVGLRASSRRRRRVRCGCRWRRPKPGSDAAPKRRAATDSSRHTTITAEPMCFSSQISSVTPSRRKALNASAGCSSNPGSVDVAGGDMVGGR